MSGFWRDRPVLVTGATGLLGGWLTQRLLTEGARPTCLVRDGVPTERTHLDGTLKRVAVVRGDVRDGALMRRIVSEYEVEVVMHLAAQTVVGVAAVNPAETFDVNVAGTWTLLDACRQSDRIRAVIFASSDKAYGIQPALPYTEEMPLLGCHPYDASKVAAEAVVQSFVSSFGTPAVITRCANLYGGGDLNWNRLVPGTIRSLLRGDRPVIRSDGTLTRDYLYVEDAADAYVRLAEWVAGARDRAGSVFNISTEQTSTVLEIVASVSKAMAIDLAPDIRGEARLEILHQHLSAKLLMAKLGWAPRHDLADGMKQTVAWYRAYLS
ncbi:MAG: NAD-dependent epimerase/dehydratase family protein [Alphaproteobacteria bacterium]|nr:NAD-dependent epimerase/dehydratase family protein [Alphaproteobacteria bacterium]